MYSPINNASVSRSSCKREAPYDVCFLCIARRDQELPVSTEIEKMCQETLINIKVTVVSDNVHCFYMSETIYIYI